MTSMHTPFDFLNSVFGVDQGGVNNNPLPETTLAAIDGGLLALPADLMQSTRGADILCALVQQVGKTGEDHIVAMDGHMKRNSMTSNNALVDRLIDAGVNPWMPSSDGQSAWEKAATLGWEGACLRFLDHPSAPQGSALGDGATPRGGKSTPWITQAADKNMLKVAKRLFAGTTNISATDEDGNTALHLAKSSKMVELLLSAKANPDALNNEGNSIEQVWAGFVREEKISAPQRHKMTTSLLLANSKDAKTATADSVAQGGLTVGVRDGGNLLKKAGWPNPRKAITSNGCTIFFERAAFLLSGNFSDGDTPSLISNTNLFKRLQQATAWIDKNELSELDEGALTLLTLTLRKTSRSGPEEGINKTLKEIENSIMSTSTSAPSSQWNAIRALDKMVELGLVKNGSEIAGNSLGGVVASRCLSTVLLDSGETPSLINAWMNRLYWGVNDAQWWNKKQKTSRFVRPDLPTEGIEIYLEDYLPLAGDKFWSEETLPFVLINRIGKAMTENKAEAYSHPGVQYASEKNPGDKARLERAFQPWLERVDHQAMAREMDKPHSQAIFQVAKKVLPELATQIEVSLLSKATPEAQGTRMRRSL